jgi:hypothetical protein
MLVRLHTFIRSVLRKNRSAFVPPDLITESVNQASFDLWRELIQDFRTTGKQSDLLSAFKASSSPPIGGGVFTVAGKSESVVAGISILDSASADSNEYPTRLLTSDSDWVLRKKLPVEDVSESLIKTFTLTTNSNNPNVALPADFMAHKGAIYTSADRKGKIVPSDEFLSQKHPVDQKEIDFQNINEDLIKSDSISITIANGIASGDLPNDYLSNTGVFYTAENREGRIYSPQEFLNKKNRIAEIDGHEEAHTVRATINVANNTLFDLPQNYVSHTKVFYNAAGFEGIILSPKEFSERKNSAVIPFEANSPIATIYDQKIEILPAADGYVFPYLALYSTTNPIATVNNNKLEVLPTGTFTFTLPYIAKYTSENPIATILDNKITVLPYGTNYVLPYVAHATERLGYSRAYKSGTSLKFDIDPAPSNAKVYYINPPNASAGSYSYTNGVVTVTATADLDWDEAAFSNIANRALLYLGVSVGDKNAITVERQVNINESDIVPRRGRTANNPRN